jgi:hypothetical protein
LVQARRLAFGAALGCLCGLLAACADCFFTMRGHLVECGTTMPVPEAAISVHIDEGLHGARTLTRTFTTDGAGSFKVSTDGTELCDSTATLTITKQGFDQLQKQFKGLPKTDPELCMTRSAAASP